MDIKIKVNGRELPAYETLGAAVRFKDETGRDLSKIDVTSISDIAVLIWARVAGACGRERIDFDMTFREFADAIDIGSLNEWAQAIQQEAAGETDPAKKKKAKN
jgi:hypothetical protein